MVPEIASLISSVKILRDFSSSLQQIKTDDAVRDKAAELNFAIIDLQNSAMAIQSQNQDLLRTNEELERQIGEIAQWDARTDRYELKTLAEGVYVYKLVAADDPSELGIPLCVNCFGNRKKSILQRAKQTLQGTIYDCPNCQTSIVDHSKPANINKPKSMSW